jgi:hypothetical protein
MTPFEEQLQKYREGNLSLPSVSTGGKKIDPMGYQLAVTKFQLSLYASGMLPTRGWKVTPIKKFFGLRGTDRKALVIQFTEILKRYEAELVDIGE